MSGILAYLQPISGDIFSLIWIFVANFVVGYLADKITRGNEFSLKKAWRCLMEACMFFLMVLSLYGIGKLKNNQEGALQCVSTVVYVVVYFYATNIFRNLRELLKDGTPAYNVVDAIYYILSFEVIKKIPLLGEYLEQRTEAKPDADASGAGAGQRARRG